MDSGITWRYDMENMPREEEFMAWIDGTIERIRAYDFGEGRAVWATVPMDNRVEESDILAWCPINKPERAS